MLLTFLPLPLGAAIWYAVGGWSWLALLRTVHDELLAGGLSQFSFHENGTVPFRGGQGPAARQAVLAAGLLVLPLAIDGLCLGSFHILMVWLMLAGLLRACRGRIWSGGLLLGLASWLKLLPLLGVGYLLLKRRWGPALVALGCALLLDLVLSLAAFGPAGTWREHAAWWNRGAAQTMNRQLDYPGASDEDRLTNQSLAVIVRRLLSSHGDPTDIVRQRVVLAHLTQRQLQVVFLGATAILTLGIAAFCRRRPGTPGREGPDDVPAQVALVVLATLWFSPVVWSYHLTAATPALALVLYRWRHRRAVAYAASGVWLAGLGLLAQPVGPFARAVGVLLWLSLLLGLALVGSRESAG